MTRIYDPSLEWVPVSSGQMPTYTTEKTLLATLSNGDVVSLCWCPAFGFAYGDEDWKLNIIAWRNLPEAYKGDK